MAEKWIPSRDDPDIIWHPATMQLNWDDEEAIEKTMPVFVNLARIMAGIVDRTRAERAQSCSTRRTRIPSDRRRGEDTGQRP